MIWAHARGIVVNTAMIDCMAYVMGVCLTDCRGNRQITGAERGGSVEAVIHVLLHRIERRYHTMRRFYRNANENCIGCLSVKLSPPISP